KVICTQKILRSTIFVIQFYLCKIQIPNFKSTNKLGLGNIKIHLYNLYNLVMQRFKPCQNGNTRKMRGNVSERHNLLLTTQNNEAERLAKVHLLLKFPL